MSEFSIYDRCPFCGGRELLTAEAQPTIKQARVVIRVLLRCAHCGKLRAETVIALSEREFTWHSTRHSR